MPYTTIDIKGLTAMKKHCLDKGMTQKDYINKLIADDIQANASKEIKKEYKKEIKGESRKP